MKQKYQQNLVIALILILPLLGVFFGLGALQTAVAAEPTAITNTITVDTTVDELTDNGNCSLREAIQAANTDTTVDACAAGDGWDTIVLPAGLYTITLSGTDDNNAVGDFDIMDSLTIEGAGLETTVIDGNAIDRIFEVNPNDENASLILQGVHLTNGSNDDGGAIDQTGGFLQVEEGLLSGNSALTGGAIRLTAGVLEIISSTLQYNMSDNNGGAINANDAVLTIQNSTIYTNTGSQGGGVYASDSSVTLHNTAVLSNTSTTSGGPGGGGVAAPQSNLIVEAGSEIAYNRANADGGAIASWDGDESVILIQDSAIHHNLGSSGGGIEAEGAVKVINSTLAANEATESSGGAINIDQGTLVIENSTLNDNDASDDGGAIDGNHATIVVESSIFERNNAGDSGGAIDLDEEGGLYIVDSIFRQNDASRDGGAINTYYAGTFLERTAFYNNHAGLDGGAVQLEDDEGAIFDQVSIVGNTAGRNGGGFMLDDEAGLELINSTVSGNSAVNFGGGIALVEDDENYVQAINSTIVSNTAGVAGGGLYADYNSSAVNSIIAANSIAGDLAAATANCYFAGNFSSGGHNILNDSGDCAATRYDTAVSPDTLFSTVIEPLADNGGVTLPDGSTLLSHAVVANSPAIDGAQDQFCLAHDQLGNDRMQGNACDIGAVESSASATLPTFNDNTITVNTTDDELNGNGNCSLREAIEAANTDTAIDACTAGNGWDTIVLSDLTYTLSITDALSEEDNNQSGDLDILSEITIQGVTSSTTIIDADQIDRVLHVISGTLRFEDATLRNGLADGGRDGGCALVKNSFMIANDFVMTQCQGADGGAVDFRQSGTFLNHGLVTDNIATSSAIINLYDASGNINNTTVISNSSQSDGVIYSGYGYLRLSNSRILSNTSSGRYGAVYAYVSGTQIENTEIAYNQTQSGGDGAAVYIEGAGVWIKDSHLHHNQSDDLAGAIYGDTSAGLWLLDTIVEENDANGDGGGLWLQTGLLQNSTIRNNQTPGSGGGLLAENLILDNTDVIGNESTDSEGGGLYAEAVLLLQSTVAQNSASDVGGGIYVDYGPIMLLETAVQGNENSGAGSDGAGMYSDDGTITLRNSLVADNAFVAASAEPAQNGGGVYICGAGVEIVNSTVTGNSNGEGGGIYSDCSDVVSVNFSTIVSNTADVGGGLFSNPAETSHFVVRNSIVAGNYGATGLDDTDADCNVAGDHTSQGYSLFGENAGCSADGPNDQTIVPNTLFTTVLNPLADNGGESETFALQSDSLAHNQIPTGVGGCGTTVVTDQRSVSRPFGNGCDIGAFELALHELTTAVIGSGTITSSPSGISCEDDCTESFYEGTEVVLTAVPETGFSFTGWSGACSGTDDCVVTMDSTQSVTATFTEYLIYLPVVLKSE